MVMENLFHDFYVNAAPNIQNGIFSIHSREVVFFLMKEICIEKEEEEENLSRWHHDVVSYCRYAITAEHISISSPTNQPTIL